MQSDSSEETRRTLAVVILAAGLGTRMKSSRPKVLHELCGRPMVSWVAASAVSLEPDRLVVVLGHDLGEVHRFLPAEAEVAIQEKQLGTGDAVRSASAALNGFEGYILVMYGDTPLISASELADVVAAHEGSGAACTMMSVELDDPSSYGRVLRDDKGLVSGIVEHRDADADQLAITEVNAGVYVFESGALWKALDEVGNDNSQGEVYLTDVVGIMAKEEGMVRTHKVDDQSVVLGVNSRLDLARAADVMQQRILAGHMLEGVTVTDPSTTYVDAGVAVGRDTVLEPMTMLRGETSIGEGCIIGPSTTLVDTIVGDGASLVICHVSGARVASGCNLGPFTFIRPGTDLAQGAKAGAFVEIKNSSVGEGSKVPHLSYIGDAEIGSQTNIGAGNITANYDGINKHRTQIGDRVHTGADTVFVAPVKAGDDSMTGAGSVITGDIADGDLGISRSDQRNIEGYAMKKLGSKKKKERK